MSLRAGGLTGLMNQPSAQVIDGSLKIQSTSDTAGSYLKRTPINEGDRKCWTWSGWVKREKYGTEDALFVSSDSNANSDYTALYFNTADELKTTSYQSSSIRWRVTTNQLFRDTGWYHIILAVDLRQSTNSNKVKLYVNGSQITSFRQEEYPSTDFETRINSKNEHSIGRSSLYNRWYSDFGMSQVYFIDGLQLGPRFFGFNDPLTGTWRPRKLREGDISLNDGTVWSSGIPGNVHASYPATNAFDGNTSTFVYASGTSTMTWTAPKPVSGKKIEVYVYAGGGWPILKVNGQSTGAVQGGTTQHNVWVDVTHLCPGGNLETIQAFGANISGTDRQSGFSAVRVDGEILIDRKVFYSKNPNNGTTWSNSLTTNAGDNFDGSGAKTKAFDGNGANKAYTGNNSNGTTQGTSYLEMVFPTAISGALRVKCDNGNTVRNTTGGGDVLLATQSTGSDNQFVDCGTVSGLTNLRVLMSGGSRPAISIIELDGHVFIDGAANNSFYLPFDGNSPIGQDKSGNTNINIGIVWSDYGDDTNINSSYPWSKAFDGQATGAYQQGAGADDGDGWARWTPGVTITVSTKLRINTDNGSTSAVKVKFSGSSEQHLTSLTDGWNDVSGTGTLEYIEIYNQGSTWSYLTAVEVDGMILVDGVNGNNWTPGKIGNTNKIDSPNLTGGTPILNTNEAGTVALPGYKTDPNASNLVVALPLIGGEGDAIFNDIAYLIKGSGSSKSFTAFTGNSDGGGKTSTRGSVLYGSSFYTTRGATNSNAGDYIERTGDSDLSMGTGDYTIEFWFHPYTYDTNDVLIDTRHPTTDWPNDDNGIMIYINANGDTAMVSNGSVQISGSGVVGKNQDNHFALTREGTTERLFVNGDLIGTATGRNNDYNRDRLHLGSSAPNGEGSSGYYNDLRVYKGVAKYTSSFKVGSPNPTVLPDTPSGVSGSSKLTKITDGAVSFDGTNDYLTIADSDDFNLGSGAFTIEGFCYLRSSSAQQFLVGMWTGNQLSYAVQTSNDANRYLRFLISDDGTGVDFDKVSTGSLRLNGWSHFAVTRSGNTFYLFVDGILVGTQSGSQTLHNSTGTLAIGARNDGTQDLNGFISNLRIVKGTALYTSNFTPPSAPLTNVTNTKLLCCTSPTNVRLSPVGPNVGITTTTRFNSNFESIPTTVNGLTVTNNGSVTTTSAGTNSYGFTNCADLTASNSLSVDLGTIPALSTIDIIFKATGATDNKYLFGIGGNGMVRRSSSNFAWYNGSDTQISTSEIVDGNWHHLRVTPTRLFFDNTLITNSTSYQLINNNGSADGDNSGHMALGAFRNGSGTIQYNASVDFGLVRVMPGVDLGAPSSYPITTNGTLSDTETIPNDGIIVARGNSAATNFNPFNTDINTVRGQETGYATLNPLDTNFGSNLKDGNLRAVGSSNWSAGHARGSIALTSGKWFWESTYSAGSSTLQFGFANTSASLSETYGTVPANSWTYYFPNSSILYPSGGVSNYFASGASLGDTIGCALDMDNGTWQFFKNGVGGTVYTLTETTASTQTIKELYPWVGSYNGTQDINFGQKPFKFPPPDGFQPLNAANVLPETVIARPDKFVGVTTYYGNGGTQQIDYGFQPDLVFGKPPKATTGGGWNWIDSVRGNKYLASQNTNAEADFTGGNGVTFNATGMSLIDTSNGDWNLNGNPGGTYVGSGGGYVYYGFKAGGNKGTFNIDDVDVGSAANAKMGVGDLNSVGLNQTQNWTSKVTWAAGGWNGAGTAPFDNDPTNYDYSSQTRANNGRATLDISSLTGSRVITVIAEQTEVTLNHAGGSTTFTPPNTSRIIHTFEPVMNPTSIEFIGLNSGSYMVLIGVYVDGARLVNSGVSATNVPSIAATGCSVGTKQGFSIVKYNSGSSGTGTIPHGLSETPTFAMIKTTGTTSDWSVYHKELGQNRLNNYLVLNTTAGSASATNIWGEHPPSPHYFGVKSGTTTATSQDCIGYFWHDVPGLQKFGIYVGNGSGTNGPFIELGFRPAIIWIKDVTASDGSYRAYKSWTIYDSKRPGYNNDDGSVLYANKNYPEGKRGNGDDDTYSENFLITNSGFKVQKSASSWNVETNENGRSFIYCAWAEAPSINLYGGQSNAR